MQETTIKLKTKKGELFEIPEGGSLGLLALGYVGIMLWREQGRKIQQEKSKSKSTTEKP